MSKKNHPVLIETLEQKRGRILTEIGKDIAAKYKAWELTDAEMRRRVGMEFECKQRLTVPTGYNAQKWFQEASDAAEKCGVSIAPLEKVGVMDETITVRVRLHDKGNIVL